MNERILIVEDEQGLVDNLKYNLEREGYETVVAMDGKEAMAALGAEDLPDMVLLDLMLPDLSGIEICRRLRSQESTRAIPVLMLTARGEEEARISGLEAGADDYVVKPCSIREIKLRVKAILRRTQNDAQEVVDERVEFGPLSVDIAGYRLFLDGERLALTALEFKLFKTLFLRRGRAQSREVLLRDVWNIEADITTRTVDTHIKRLRQKLGRCAHFVETVRGVGYRFVKEHKKTS